MIVGGSEEFNLANSKYYQFYSVSTIVEHVIDCFTDETNPYHPSLSWLTRKQPKPLMDELCTDLFEQCSVQCIKNNQDQNGSIDDQRHHLSSNVQAKLDKLSLELRREIVNRTKDGCSPLFLASKFGHLDIVNYLVEKCDADIEQTGRYEVPEDHHIHSVSPIWAAAVRGNKDVVEALIKFGANVNSLSDTGSTPLRSVCYMCRSDDGDRIDRQTEYFEVVRLLVDNGADVHKPNFNGGTCLINSLHNFDLTLYMINCGADVNASDHQAKTALHYAIQEGRLDIVKLLLSHGADSTLKANFSDDALQLCCLYGNQEIFRFLVRTIDYSKQRLQDAYKLMGCSFLEISDDLSTVRELWRQSTEKNPLSAESSDMDSHKSTMIESSGVKIDLKRFAAFGSASEFISERDLDALSADDYRIQSLIITQRIIGPNHRETIQRILCRGRFYLGSSRPDRCLRLWVYALDLRLRYESILHFESITAAGAITRLILNLISIDHTVKHEDVYDVLSLLVQQLDESNRFLSFRPVYCVHLDVFDALLNTIINLMFALDYTSSSRPYATRDTSSLVRKLVDINPRTSKGSSLLHICVTACSRDGGDLHKILTATGKPGGVSPVIKLIDAFTQSGLELEATDDNGLSALQALCLADTRTPNKLEIVRHLVGLGAHIDRRAPTLEHAERIRQALAEAKVDVFQRQRLSCLAARKLMEIRSRYDGEKLPEFLKQTMEMH